VQVCVRLRRRVGETKPSGVRAGPFSINCWLIANTALSLDLQQEVLKLMFDCRTMLSRAYSVTRQHSASVSHGELDKQAAYGRWHA
jgi:hypothetical protein